MLRRAPERIEPTEVIRRRIGRQDQETCRGEFVPRPDEEVTSIERGCSVSVAPDLTRAVAQEQQAGAAGEQNDAGERPTLRGRHQERLGHAWACLQLDYFFLGTRRRYHGQCERDQRRRHRRETHTPLLLTPAPA